MSQLTPAHAAVPGASFPGQAGRAGGAWGPCMAWGWAGEAWGPCPALGQAAGGPGGERRRGVGPRLVYVSTGSGLRWARFVGWLLGPAPISMTARAERLWTCPTQVFGSLPGAGPHHPAGQRQSGISVLLPPHFGHFRRAALSVRGHAQRLLPSFGHFRELSGVAVRFRALRLASAVSVPVRALP